ncbi:hypothetical protein JAO29_19155 [Edaphobacter sp. HDX4]|uniref:hypothetical protein n=1 Tax=Edaphobacter sp. HDX4 TaxID=2794064 RepID=UPI002FE5EDC8
MKNPLFLLKLSFCCLLVVGAGKAWPQTSNAGFEVYANCKITDGPSVVEIAPLAPGISSRTVETMNGPRQIPMVSGRRIMFAYPDKDFYANVKVEILPADNYAETRQYLIDNFDHILASGETERNYRLKPLMNGLDTRGMDRTKIEGGVLGIYLIFDDANRTVSTIYFLNQDAEKRSFQTIEEYRQQRDRFLAAYTGCAHPKIRSGN